MAGSTSTTLSFHINGQPFAYPPDQNGPASLLNVLTAWGLNPDQGGVAVALNNEVAPRSTWSQTELNPGDRLEVVHARQGG